MKCAWWILGMLTVAAGAMAYPIPDSSTPVLDDPNAAAVDREWLASSSFFFNQLRAISQTPLMPAVPRAQPDRSGGPPALAEVHSTSLGFQYDLNLDGKLDEFLPLPLPALLGASYNPERTDDSRIGSKIFALAIPSFGPASDDRACRQLWLQALSASQKVDIIDAGAMARGQAGLAGQARWHAAKAGPAAPPASTSKLAGVPGLSIGWLALLLGGSLILWQWRLFRRPLSS